MKRYDIINYIIKRYDYRSYLEIGTQLDKCISNIKCIYKVGVDPFPAIRIEGSCDSFYELTSDEYFASFDFGYDIIFIDGLHYSKQTIKDIQNSLNVLNQDGTIIVHDCRPLSEKAQQVPMPHVSSWNGDVWRAWLKFRHDKKLSMFVVNEDNGCGIIQRGKQINPLNLNYEKVRYQQFDKYKKVWLNLIEFKDIDKWLR